MTGRSLQETYAPESLCFGCGPRNDKGLRIRSFADGRDAAHCRFAPEAHHAAFPGVLSGGICGTLLDCHSNWTAAWHLMNAAGAAEPPSTVTAEFTVRLHRPTPMDQALLLRSRVIASSADRATIACELTSGDRVTASFEGVFVAVKEGHPAYHRW